MLFWKENSIINKEMKFGSLFEIREKSANEISKILLISKENSFIRKQKEIMLSTLNSLIMFELNKKFLLQIFKRLQEKFNFVFQIFDFINN